MSERKPEIDIVKVGINAHGITRDFWYPKCRQCGWTGEMVVRDGLAKVDAATHLRLRCLSTSGA